MKLVIAGASGFIGSRLIRSFEKDSRIERIVALSRFARENPVEGKTRWEKADLANRIETEAALQGADLAIYLVHSMSPQARLSQGSFDDFDLFQADNFARSCARSGVTRIFYLGGLIPEGETHLSDHLRSRLEVERVLSSHGAELTGFRAGLILGRGGSSSEMLIKLVKRLPLIASPKWTRTLSEPVSVRDVVTAIHETLFRPELHGKVWDITAGISLSYEDLMRKVAQHLGVRRVIIPIPLLSPSLSRLWVSLVTGASLSLVAPLIRSLTHAMTSRPSHRLLPKLGITPQPLGEALEETLAEGAKSKSRARASVSRAPNIHTNTVRSIQRIQGFSDKSFSRLGSIAETYFFWLPRALLGVVSIRKVDNDGSSRVDFRLRGTKLSLLELVLSAKNDHASERFEIRGGFLHTAGSGGILEFRKIRGELCVLSIVQDFVPRLPWSLYRITQAVAHSIVMRRFGAFLVARNRDRIYTETA